jgi:hypothetical protein
LNFLDRDNKRSKFELTHCRPSASQEDSACYPEPSRVVLRMSVKDLLFAFASA